MSRTHPLISIVVLVRPSKNNLNEINAAIKKIMADVYHNYEIIFANYHRMTIIPWIFAKKYYGNGNHCITFNGEYIIIISTEVAEWQKMLVNLLSHRDKGGITLGVPIASKQGILSTIAAALGLLSRFMYGYFLRLSYFNFHPLFMIYDSTLHNDRKLNVDNKEFFIFLFRMLEKHKHKITSTKIPFSISAANIFINEVISFFAFPFIFFMIMFGIRWVNQMILYFFNGLLCLSADFGVYVFLLKIMKCHYFISGIAGFIAGFTVNFIFGRVIVFRDGARFKALWKEVLAVLTISILGLVIHQVILVVCVEILFLGKIAAKAVAVAVVFFWNFFGRKFIVYH